MKREHYFLVKTKRFRIYLNGSYSRVEIDFGRVGRDLAFYFFNEDCWLRIRKYNTHNQTVQF